MGQDGTGSGNASVIYSGNRSGTYLGNRSRIRSGNAVGNGWEHDGELGLEKTSEKEGNVTESCIQLSIYRCTALTFVPLAGEILYALVRWSAGFIMELWLRRFMHDTPPPRPLSTKSAHQPPKNSTKHRKKSKEKPSQGSVLCM